MRHLFTTLVLLLLAPLAQAFTYQDSDVLLVFRKDGSDDVLFNLGSISQFLNRTDGEEVQVTNFNLELVRSKYDLTDEVKVALLATTSKDVVLASRAAWLSDADADSQPVELTASQWQQLLWSKINSVGVKAQEFSKASATNVFTAPASLPSTYTYIVGNGGTSANLLSTLGGSTSFKVESGIPATLKFYAIKPSTVSPKPASKLIGRFTFGTDGALKFIAGPAVVQPPLDPVQISAITYGANGASVTFPSVANAKYRLLSSDSPAGPVSGWTVGTTSVVGTGGAVSLADDSPVGTQKFYAVETFR
jgi:hypothetical protein